jgi:hypothetical protein
MLPFQRIANGRNIRRLGTFQECQIPYCLAGMVSEVAPTSSGNPWKSSSLRFPPLRALWGCRGGYGRLRIAHEDVPSTHRKSCVPEESTQHDTIVRNRTKPGKGLSYTQGVPFLRTSIEKKSDLVLYTRWTHPKTAHIWIYETRPKSPTILTRINSGCRRNMHAVPKPRSVLTYYQLADGRVCTVPPILE